MNVPFVDLAAQSALLERVVDAVLREGRFVGGPRVAEFERRFAAFCGPAAECVGVGSGTDAIELALRALGVRPGDEVITVANTCVPTVAGIEAAGATAVLVDALPETATIDPDRLGAALSGRTRAIVPVHLYGRCADMDGVNAFARDHGLRVLEDAAQAHGAEFHGRRAGTLADAAAFSFYPTKNLGAVGDAGAVVTTDPEIAERVRLLHAYGERQRYRSELSGRNSRLDTLQAAVLAEKLLRLEEWNERRRELAALYRRELDGAAVRLLTEDEGSVHHLFVVRSAQRDDLQRSLATSGIETLVHYPRAVHQHPAYERLGHGALPVSERLCAEVLSLPLHPELTDETVRTIAAAVHRAA